MNSLRSSFPRACTALALLALCVPAHAVIIQPNTAVASSTAGGSYAAVNTINGSGLTGTVGTLPTHLPYDNSPANHWTSDGSGPLNEFITWGFTVPQTLNTIYLWNHQSTTPLASNSGYDVGNFALTFYDSSNVQIGTFSGTLAFDSNAAQGFNFGTIAGISSVRFDVNSVQSSPNYTGLAEVAFDLVPVNPSNAPDAGSTAALLGLSVVALGFFSRRFSPA